MVKQCGLALTALTLPIPAMSFTATDQAMKNKEYDVIIVGGSYAGLSAAMALGRALRNVLVVDSGTPCNRQTPHSHNFLTQDGQKPGAIAALAKAQVQEYRTVNFLTDVVLDGRKMERGFTVTTRHNGEFNARRIIFATGLKDIMPDLTGFTDCWGISVIHCPYCHGYEYSNRSTGILANGDVAFHYAKLIGNWTKQLTILTNGAPILSDEQLEKVATKGVRIISKQITSLNHNSGLLHSATFSDETSVELTAIYSRPPFLQQCSIPEALGAELTEQGLVKVDMFQKTTVAGVYACGDNTTMMRSVANAVSAGNMTGAVVNNELIEEEF